MSSEGSEGAGRRRRGSVDSDFVADEDESGSDWESSSRKPVKPKVSLSHCTRDKNGYMKSVELKYYAV